MFGRKGASGQEAFTREVAALLAEMPAVASVKLQGELHLFIRYSNGAEGHKFLGNLWAETREMSPRDRADRVLHELASTRDVGGGPRSWADAQSHILPVLRNPRHLAVPEPAVGDAARLVVPPLSAEGRAQHVHFTASRFLLVMAVIDQERTMSYVMQYHLEDWAMTAGELFSQSLGNLKRSGMNADVLGGGVVVRHPRSYGSSWMAVPGIFDEVAEMAGDEVVAVAPERDSAYFIKWRHVSVVQSVLGVAMNEYETNPRAISPVFYRQDAQHRLEPWTPPTDYPNRNDVLRARSVVCQAEYEWQREYLEKVAVSTGEDVLVAPVTLREIQGGRTLTGAVWPKGATNALLPYHVDEVHLTDPNAHETVTVRWRDLEEHAHAFLRTEPSLNPPRVRISGWPGDVLSELRERAARLAGSPGS